jgi:signal transduction histidine kinase
MNAEERDQEAHVRLLEQSLATAKEQLIEAHHMISVGMLLTGIVHEINSPIGSIVSNNEVTTRSLSILKEALEQAQAEGVPPPSKSAKILDTLLSLAAIDKIACERIISVIRSLKTFVGGKTNEFRKTNLNDVVENSLKLARCEFRHRIQVETDYGDLPEVECDAHKLGQVFLNILINAGHAITGQGKVTIHTSMDGDCALVTIGDTGSGIPPEVRSKVFALGFTTKPAGVGTGLGLALSKEIIVETHGGSIDFNSDMGHGTTFYVRIPVESPVKAS